MDSEFGHILDALAGTPAERFGEFLTSNATAPFAANNPPSPSPHIQPHHLSLEMPLLALARPHPATPPLDEPLDLAVDPPNNYLPLPSSAVTGASDMSRTTTPNLKSEPVPHTKCKRRRSPIAKSREKSTYRFLKAAHSDVSSYLTSQTLPAPSPALSPAKQPAVPNTAPKSHTRKCREKVTKQFDNLLQVLPIPPRGVEVKHKAQILDYTIRIFRKLLLQRTLLQTEIALASKPALQQWMNATITAANPHSIPAPLPISTVLEPFVGLYCVKKSWTYGELWLVGDDPFSARLSFIVFNTDDANVLKKVDAFATTSRARYSAMAPIRTGIIARALASRRPEWLSDLKSDPSVFDRAQLAAEHGMCVAEAVPVMLDNTRCAAVMLFGDVKQHTYSTADLSVVLDYATVLGTSFAAYQANTSNSPAHPVKVEPSESHIQEQDFLSSDMIPPASETSASFFDADYLSPR